LLLMIEICDVSVGSFFPAFRRNVGKYEPTDRVPRPRRPGFSTTQLWKH